MLHKIFKSRFHIKPYLKAPYLKERLAYLDYWQKQGASLLTLRKIATSLLIIVNNLKLNPKKLISVKEVDSTFEQLVYRARNRKKRRRLLLPTKKYCAGHAKKWLKMLGLLNDTPIIDYPFYRQLFSYERYQCQERGLAKRTIADIKYILKAFFIHLSKKKLLLSRVFAHRISILISFMKKMDILGVILKRAHQ